MNIIKNIKSNKALYLTGLTLFTIGGYVTLLSGSLLPLGFISVVTLGPIAFYLLLVSLFAPALCLVSDDKTEKDNNRNNDFKAQYHVNNKQLSVLNITKSKD